jgi:hypothetical protein
VATLEDNIKTVLTKAGCGDIDWFQTAQSRAQNEPLQSSHSDSVIAWNFLMSEIAIFWEIRYTLEFYLGQRKNIHEIFPHPSRTYFPSVLLSPTPSSFFLSVRCPFVHFMVLTCGLHCDVLSIWTIHVERRVVAWLMNYELESIWKETLMTTSR